jgi:hypothetical protein
MAAQMDGQTQFFNDKLQELLGSPTYGMSDLVFRKIDNGGGALRKDTFLTETYDTTGKNLVRLMNIPAINFIIIPCKQTDRFLILGSQRRSLDEVETGDVLFGDYLKVSQFVQGLALGQRWYPDLSLNFRVGWMLLILGFLLVYLRIFRFRYADIIQIKHFLKSRILEGR